MSKAMQSRKSMDRIDSVLKRHHLKKTLLRRKILFAFLDARRPLTQADLIAALLRLGARVDRVSVYRNLSSLKDAGILHEVDANNYVYCSHDCDQHGHLLLFCQKCSRHQEIKDHDRIASLMVELNGLRFFSKQQPLFLKGTCASCS